MERATFAGGCFWCFEPVFDRLDGVEEVIVGYTGGDVDDPSYEDVTRGTTGHAEAFQLTYDPEVISYRELLEVFFTVHDPTTKNRQGPDVGPQYRSAIFYHNDEQRRKAECFIKRLEQSGAYTDSIVTDIEPLDTFWGAEEEHREYYEKHPEAAYCRVNIAPKLAKLKERFPERLKA